MQPAEVVRTVDLDAGVDEVWEVLCEADGWLADEGALDVREGGQGLLVERGVARRAVVESVRPGEHLVYRWWQDGGDGTDASRVEIRVVPDGATTRVTVRETHLGASLPIATNSVAGRAWSLRLAFLGFASDLAVARAAGRVLVSGNGVSTVPIDEVFAALADPTRRSLYGRLLDDGPDTATRLADEVPVSRQAVVKHLQVLAAAGLLAPERAGREVRWTPQPAGLDDAVAWMVQAGGAWDRRLGRLDGRLARRR